MPGKSYAEYYDTIQSRAVEWLWYPYIPYGKITLIQGDPGDGKTTFAINLAAIISKGAPLPETVGNRCPENVIYQNTEDGMADTIKPRLERADADCKRIAYITEREKTLTLSDERLEKSIIETGARLLVLDPLQAFIGADADMHRANDIRSLMNNLAAIAERTKCAIIIIGHMNKSMAAKGLYRGLGSIDIPASARSILLLGRLKDDPSVRIMAHLKSNLAPEGKSVGFELNPDNGLKWLGTYDITAAELLEGAGAERKYKGKVGEAVSFLKDILAFGEKPAEDIIREGGDDGISLRTLERAKKALRVKSRKFQDKWYWALH